MDIILTLLLLIEVSNCSTIYVNGRCLNLNLNCHTNYNLCCQGELVSPHSVGSKNVLLGTQ